MQFILRSLIGPEITGLSLVNPPSLPAWGRWQRDKGPGAWWHILSIFFIFFLFFILCFLLFFQKKITICQLSIYVTFRDVIIHTRWDSHCVPYKVFCFFSSIQTSKKASKQIILLLHLPFCRGLQPCTNSVSVHWVCYRSGPPLPPEPAVLMPHYTGNYYWHLILANTMCTFYIWTSYLYLIWLPYIGTSYCLLILGLHTDTLSCDFILIPYTGTSYW